MHKERERQERHRYRAQSYRNCNHPPVHARIIAGSMEFAPPFWRAICAPATLAGRRVPNSDTSEWINTRPAGLVFVALSFRKAFHIIGNDNLRRVSFADGLQVLQTTSQLGSGVPQASFKRRLGRPASFFVRELLKHHGGEEPPLRPVVGGCRADRVGEDVHQDPHAVRSTCCDGGNGRHYAEPGRLSGVLIYLKHLYVQ
jgi:hypothetical protein